MAVLSRRDDPEARSRGEAELIEAAITLLGEGQSFADMTVAAITSQAGHTRTGFYFYFRDKRDLLMSATRRLVGGLFADADHWWGGEGGRPALEIALKATLRDYRQSRALIRAVIEATSYDRVVAEYWGLEIERFVDATEGRIPADVAPTLRRGVASALVLMVERTYYTRILDDDTAGDEVAVASLVEVWARALALPR